MTEVGEPGAEGLSGEARVGRVGRVGRVTRVQVREAPESVGPRQTRRRTLKKIKVQLKVRNNFAFFWVRPVKTQIKIT